MQILRAADRKGSPWKNGAGVTWEVAASPHGAGFDAFDWRVSIAEVATRGPFSTFPKIDRVLTVISGDGLILDIEGRGRRELGLASAPLAFPGDAACHAALIGGPIRDFNVMTRRGRWRASVRRIAGPTVVDALANTTVLLVLNDTQVSAQPLSLEDAIVTPPGSRLSLGPGIFVIAEIDPD